MEIEENNKTATIIKFLAFGLLSFYFLFKILHLLYFDYSLDLYSCLQLSRDWYLGKPLLYENLFGPYANQHNCFILLLFFPISIFTGVYAFFLVQFLVWLSTINVTLKLLKNQSTAIKAIVCFVLLLGPVGYYQYDNPTYGFNPELLFVPFLICFTSAVLNNNRLQITIWYVLIILIREDGIIAASCVHVMIFYLQPGNSKNLFRSIWEHKKIVLMGLGIFILGISRMLLLKSNNTSRMACIEYDLTVLTPQQLLNYFVPDVSKALLLMLSGFVVLLIILTRKRKFLAVLVFLLPMISSNMIASIFNFSHETGSCFAPRISFVYGPLVSAVLVVLFYNSIHFSKFKIVALSLILLLIQYWSLIYVRKYNYIQNSFALIMGNNKSEQELDKISEMKAFSNSLPKNFPLEIPWKYFTAFNSQDICFPERSYNAFIKPSIIIAEKNSPEKWSPPAPGMIRKESENFIYYFAENAIKFGDSMNLKN